MTRAGRYGTSSSIRAAGLLVAACSSPALGQMVSIGRSSSHGWTCGVRRSRPARSITPVWRSMAITSSGCTRITAGQRRRCDGEQRRRTALVHIRPRVIGSMRTAPALSEARVRSCASPCSAGGSYLKVIERGGCGSGVIASGRVVLLGRADSRNDRLLSPNTLMAAT